MQGRQLQITAHLFKIEKTDSNSSYNVFLIRNSSRKKIKNKARLRRKYLKNFQTLIEQFDKSSANQMDIHYLNRYIYHFQKVEGDYVEVFKSPQDHPKWIPWARYPLGKIEFSEPNYDGRYEYRTTFTISDDNDPFDEVQSLKEEKYCAICKKLITCFVDGQDLHSWQYHAVAKRQELNLELLEIPPLCLRCVKKIKSGEIDLTSAIVQEFQTP